MILRIKKDEAAERPTSFLCVLFFGEGNRGHRREPRGEKEKTCCWFSTFPSVAKPGGGNVGISPERDFQGAVERAGKLLLLFRAFHRHVISTALLPTTALLADFPF
jgi:hypothetical protein